MSYDDLLIKISNRMDSPFKFPLKEYIKDISKDKTRCQYCHISGKDGVQLGQSPKFDKDWTFGKSVCFHTCNDCHCKVYDNTRKILKTIKDIKRNTVRKIDSDERFIVIKKYNEGIIKKLNIMLQDSETGDVIIKKCKDATYFDKKYVILSW